MTFSKIENFHMVWIVQDNSYHLSQTFRNTKTFWFLAVRACPISIKMKKASYRSRGLFVFFFRQSFRKVYQIPGWVFDFLLTPLFALFDNARTYGSKNDVTRAERKAWNSRFSRTDGRARGWTRQFTLARTKAPKQSISIALAGSK